jgi:hypothetical protein
VNETDPPVYTPLRKTQVIITNTQKLIVSVPTLYEIPRGGNTLPSAFTVSYGPDVGFEITLTFAQVYPGITMDNSNAIFRSGQVNSPFTIFSSNDSNITGAANVKTGTVLLSLSGVNKEMYSLSQSSVSFQVINPITVPPDITELNIGIVTQNSATITIGTSAICMAYWMLALDGTSVPSFSQVYNQGPAPYASTRSIYGSVQIGTTNIATLTFNNLVAQTPYQIFAYVVDRQGNTNDPKSKSFVTLSKKK